MRESRVVRYRSPDNATHMQTRSSINESRMNLSDGDSFDLLPLDNYSSSRSSRVIGLPATIR